MDGKNMNEAYTIIINAKPTTATSHLTFEQIVGLARANKGTTITYGHGPNENPEGELLDGQKVKVKDGMVFSVIQTDNA